MIGTIITIVLVLWGATVVFAAVQRNAARLQGQNKCHQCGARLALNPIKTGFMATCRKCGATRPARAARPAKLRMGRQDHG